MAILAETSFQDEAFGMELALYQCHSCNLIPDKIFTDCANVIECISKRDNHIMWRFIEVLEKFRICCPNFPGLNLNLSLENIILLLMPWLHMEEEILIFPSSSGV